MGSIFSIYLLLLLRIVLLEEVQKVWLVKNTFSTSLMIDHNTSNYHILQNLITVNSMYIYIYDFNEKDNISSFDIYQLYYNIHIGVCNINNRLFIILQLRTIHILYFFWERMQIVPRQNWSLIIYQSRLLFQQKQ